MYIANHTTLDLGHWKFTVRYTPRYTPHLWLKVYLLQTSDDLGQEVINSQVEEHWISVPILYRITLQNLPYMDFNLLVLISFEVTIVTTMVFKSLAAVQ